MGTRLQRLVVGLGLLVGLTAVASVCAPSEPLTESDELRVIPVTTKKLLHRELLPWDERLEGLQLERS